MKEKLKLAIKGNVFIVWLRILFDKIGESFSLTLYSACGILLINLNVEHLPYKSEFTGVLK